MSKWLQSSFSFEAPPRRLHTVPPGVPFLRALARSVLDGTLTGSSDPLALAGVRIFLPTQRACRALTKALLAEAGFGPEGGALILPRIQPIGAGDAAAALFTSGEDDAVPPDRPQDRLAGILPALPELHRRLVLTRLVRQWTAQQAAPPEDAEPSAGEPMAAVATPAEAVGLATGLSRLMDMLETEGVSFARFPQLVPPELAGHWQRTLDFLGIVTQLWPAYLSAAGAISAAERRNRLLAREADALKQHRGGPVIVAGVTGSIPATAALMRAVTSLPQHAIVLPGLDLELDTAAWTAAAADAGHPQYRLAALLSQLGAKRAEVTLLPGLSVPPELAARGTLIGEAMRPAATTAAWSTLVERLPAAAVTTALKGVTLLAADSAEEEAEAIALILRQTAEVPGRTAALVTSDRTLARRVETRLRGWEIAIDDSAGRPFGKTVPGAFLDLVAEVFTERAAPATVVALLKHPLARLGLDVGPVRRAARMLELAAFRRIYLGDGFAGIAAALGRAFEATSEDDLERPHRAVRKMAERDQIATRDLLERLTAAFAPLEALRGRECSLAELAAAHLATATALARVTDGDPAADTEAGAGALFAGEAGAAASELFAGLTDPSVPPVPLAAEDYRDVYRALIAGQSVRARGAVHPRLAIWGPFEARLQRPDIVILGGLVDGVWPEIAEPEPWLSRPMLAALGLPTPETRMGDAAHDFSQLLGAPKVYLTYAAKIDGVPKVASRWLLRLEALLAGRADLRTAAAGEPPWLDWARQRNRAPPPKPVLPPAPAPPVVVRPRQMSVTRVEVWLRNPYAIYASRILNLEPMPGLGHAPGDQLRGTMVHAVLNRFSERWPDALPADIAAELTRSIDHILTGYRAHPRVAALWRPRLIRFADWFAATEAVRRTGLALMVTEVAGSLTLTAPEGDFELTARADRIDVRDDGTAVITDYKSGTPPKDKQVQELFSPQLPLEAAILAADGFVGVPSVRPAGLRYISARGGVPAGTERLVNVDVAALATEAVERLGALVATFDRPETPYRALRRPRMSYRFDEYAHLARVKAWTAAEDDTDAED